MSRKGDRMDAVRVQLKKKYTYRRMRTVSDHMINDTLAGTVRPSHMSGSVDYAMLGHTKYFWSMDRLTGVKECEGR